MIDWSIYDIEKISHGKYDIYKIYERFQATMYLVCGGERACLIDTGFGLCDLKALAGSLTALPVFVIHTHGHTDHVLGSRWFARAMLHPADKALYREITAGFGKMLEQPWVKQTYGDYIRGIDPAEVRFPDPEDIRQGDTIDLGEKKLRAIEMPGHTSGSIALLDCDEKICFSGDSIMEHPWLFLEESLPPDTYLRSLRRAVQIMRDAGVQRIYSGHYAYKPLTLEDTPVMLAGMEKVCAGEARGKHFENMVGSGVEYVFGDWSVLCCEKTSLPK